MRKIFYKHISLKLFVLLGLLIQNTAMGQLNLTCGNSMSNNSTQVDITTCTKNSTVYLAKYKRKESWLPDANMPVKTLHINFNIWQKSDGTGNFVDNPATRARFMQIAAWINNKYQNINTSTIPPLSYYVATFADSKIRIVVDGIYFYQDPSTDNSYYNGYYGHNIILDTYLKNNYPERTKALNIHISNLTIPGVGGYSDYGSIESTYKTNPDAATNTVHDYWYSQHWAHEIGHAFDLWHTYNANWQQNCNPNYVDFLTDIYDVTKSCNTGCTVCLINATNYPVLFSQNNNLMGGKSEGHISALQMGIIHRSTALRNFYNINYNVRDHITGYSSYPYEITQNETWDFSIKFYQDIVVKTGNTLTIKCEVWMVPQAKIIIEPGAELIIDGGTISNEPYYNDYWQGIEVWGDKTKRQLDANQGKLQVINGGTIKNAHNAITAGKRVGNSFDWTKGGGIIKLNDANLVNNNFDLWIGAYQNFIILSNKKHILPNRSRIINSHFENNDNMLPAHDGYAFVGLWDVGPIVFKGNTFKNLKTGQSTQEKGYGIMAYSSTINLNDYCPSTGSGYVSLSQSQAIGITPCNNAVRNHFEGLFYGVRAINVTGLANSIINIDRAEFENVYHGVHIKNAKYALVTRCDFNIPSTDLAAANNPDLYDAYGVYLDGSDAYRVEENTFAKNAAQQGIRGIMVSNSGGSDNEIYHNTLTDMGYAIQAQDNNRNNDGSEGLGIYCNSMSNGFSDIVVLDDGIAENQKITITGGSNGVQHFAAGDIFTPCSNNTYQNYYNASSGNITYYADANNMPACTHGVTVDPNNYLARSCPVKLGMTLNIALSGKSSAKLAWNSAKTILTIWKDGGNANLEDEVETTQPWDVYVEFNSLLAESPYLSDEVLLATIENPAFTSLMIKLLMVANTHASHNDEIMQAIYNRIPAMPEAYIAEIEAGEGEVSQLEILEANVSACQHSYEIFTNNAKRIYRMEYEDGGSMSNYINFVDALNTLESEYELAALYLESGDYTDMTSTLNNILSNYDLSTQQTTDLANWQAYFGIAKLVKEGGIMQGMLSESQKTQLEAIVEQESSEVSSAARAMLMFNNPEYNYVEVVKPITISEARKAKPIIDDNKPLADEVFKVYPNPSHDFITIEYRTGDKYTKLSIAIKDATGKTVYTKQLKVGDSEEMINLTELKSGVYSLMLYGDKSLIEVKKITVIK